MIINTDHIIENIEMRTSLEIAIVLAKNDELEGRKADEAKRCSTFMNRFIGALSSNDSTKELSAMVSEAVKDLT